jgi:hypothetical protein
MDTSPYDLVPTALAVIFAACVLWVLWRLIRALFRPSPVRIDPPMPLQPEQTRSDPPLVRSTVTAPAIPDAADVLALKASIDNLARQIAVLERRLAVSSGAAESTAGMRPDEPAQAPAEPPIIVPERRA